jgi:uncharacterized OB-fold protein
MSLVADMWWEATRDLRLLVQRCEQCGHRQHHPRSLCTHCGSTDVGWVDAAGAGQLFSFTVVCRSASSHFDAPYVLALVDLDEGVRMLTHIVDADPDTLRCDHPVRVRWVRHPDDADQERPRHLPCFAIEEQ